MIKPTKPAPSMTRDAATRLARVLPAGRLPDHHFEIVWANFCDVFESRDELLKSIAGGQSRCAMAFWAEDVLGR